MINHIANCITAICLKEGVISEEKEIEIKFGLEELIFLLINLVFMALLAVFSHEILKGFLYCVVYISLARLVGIYHAKTRFSCFCKTIFMFAAYLVVMKNFPLALQGYGTVVGALVFCITAWLLTPVTHKNKVLTERQKQENRNKILRYSVVYLVVTAILMGMNQIQYAFAISVTLLWVAVLAILGQIFNEK